MHLNKTRPELKIKIKPNVNFILKSITFYINTFT